MKRTQGEWQRDTIELGRLMKGFAFAQRELDEGRVEKAKAQLDEGVLNFVGKYAVSADDAKTIAEIVSESVDV